MVEYVVSAWTGRVMLSILGRIFTKGYREKNGDQNGDTAEEDSC